jgi:predicted dehydrogenase
MPTPVTVGFIGAGGIASRHIGNLAQLPDVRITGVADVAPERAEEQAARVGATPYHEYTEMLDREKPDAVYICLPPFVHGAPERALIERRIPFFVEKPLATTLETATEILEGVERAGLVTAVGYHWRQLEPINGVKNSLPWHPPRMALGYWLDMTPPPAWWRKQAQSGGQMLEQTTHIFDLARYLLGEVDRVFALAAFQPRERYPDADVADVSTATLQFKSGAIATLSSTCILESPYRIGLDVLCEGIVYECTEQRVWVDHGWGHREEWTPQADPFLIEDGDFLTAVREHNVGGVRVPYAEAYQTHRLVARCVESAQAGRPLEL